MRKCKEIPNNIHIQSGTSDDHACPAQGETAHLRSRAGIRARAHNTIADIIHRRDHRLLVICGPLLHPRHWTLPKVRNQTQSATRTPIRILYIVMRVCTRSRLHQSAGRALSTIRTWTAPLTWSWVLPAPAELLAGWPSWVAAATRRSTHQPGNTWRTSSLVGHRCPHHRIPDPQGDGLRPPCRSASKWHRRQPRHRHHACRRPPAPRFYGDQPAGSGRACCIPRVTRMVM